MSVEENNNDIPPIEPTPETPPTPETISEATNPSISSDKVKKKRSNSNPDPLLHMSVEVTTNNLEAFMVIDTVGMNFNEINQTEIYSYITNNTKLASDMVNFNAINDIMAEINKIKNGNSEETTVRMKICEGVPVVKGIDGWVKFYHPHNQRVVIRDDGKADYRNLDKYISIKKGEKIATVFQGVPGKQGKNVYGELLNPPSIKKPKVVIGSNINTDTVVAPEDPEKIFLEYTAATNGVLFTTDESINVSEQLNIGSSVGLTTGNVNYQGTVTVEGSIEEGSKVACTGALIVNENVESSDLEVGGDLAVKGGIKLKNKGVIKVKGNVSAKFIENTIIEVDGDVIIEGSILNSKIYCLGSVLLTGQNSAILGSEIIAFSSLSTFNLGSNAGVDVVVEMGYHFRNDRLFSELGNMIRNSEKELSNLIPQVQQMNNIIKQSRGKVDEARKTKYKNLIDTFKKKNDFHKKLINKYEELKTTRYNSEKINLIVKGAAFPGATIKYRRQVEKLSVMQTSFMMNFFHGQDHATMVAISDSGAKKPPA